MKTYMFRVEVEQDEDGRWSAEIPVLPGCAAWGYTREEALEALQDGAQAYLEVMMEHNDPLPREAEEESMILSTTDACPPLPRGDYRGVVSPMAFDLP